VLCNVIVGSIGIHSFIKRLKNEKGLLKLSPPLPINVTLITVHQSSYATPAKAFTAANTLIMVTQHPTTTAHLDLGIPKMGVGFRSSDSVSLDLENSLSLSLHLLIIEL
jgi:hypothetical protein